MDVKIDAGALRGPVKLALLREAYRRGLLTEAQFHRLTLAHRKQ